MALLTDVIESLPQAVTNPLAFVAFVLAVAVWGLMWFRTRRLKVLLARLDAVPASGRADLIRAEMGVVVPRSITAEQWIRSQRHRYMFAAFVVVCLLVLSVVGIAGWTTWQGRSALRELRAEMATVHGELDTLNERVGRLSFDPESGRLQVEWSGDTRDRVEALTLRLEEVTRRLSAQEAGGTLADEDRRRLTRAEAAIQHNRGLIHLQQGNPARAAEEFGTAVAQLDTLVDGAVDPEVSAELARSLIARGLVGVSQGQPGARRDLERATEISRELPGDVMGAMAGDLALADVALGLPSRANAGPDQPASEGESPSLAVDGSQAVTVVSSPVSAVVVHQITLPDFPRLARAGLVAAGTELSASTPVEQMTEEPGAAMLVNAGHYDVVVQAPNGSLIKILNGIDVENGQTLEVDTDALVAAIAVSPLTVDGMPAVERVFVVQDSTRIGEAREANGPILVLPSTRYDVWYTPAGQRDVLLMGDVEASPGQLLRIEANERMAAIAARDPGIPGVRLESIQAVAAGTDITGSYTYLREVEGFGVPLMLYAGDSYDIVLRTEGGRPIRLAQNVGPLPGGVTWVGRDP